jgi:hypothetical protein
MSISLFVAIFIAYHARWFQLINTDKASIHTKVIETSNLYGINQSTRLPSTNDRHSFDRPARLQHGVHQQGLE